MAYTPNAATEAALAKSRKGQKLTPAEQQLLTAHSKAMVADMTPTAASGSGPYDYAGGTTGGYGNAGASNDGGTGSRSVTGTDGQPYFLPDSAGDQYAKYQNFIRTETERRQVGLPPRPLPSTFTQFLGTQNPLGYTGQGDVQEIKSSPLVNSMGVSADPAKVLSASQRSDILRSQPMLPSTPYSAPTPQANPGVSTTPTGNPTTVSSAPGTTTLPFNVQQALPSAPQTINLPGGGLQLGNSVAGIDEGKVLAEAEMQKQLASQTYQQQVAGRKAMLDELSGVLQKQQSAALGDQMPGIYEDLNTRGLLRSSALGEKVGLEATKLARQTSEQLALQGLTDRGTAINDLSGIENSYLGQRNSALQRRFSLEDFDRQVAAGEKLGANALPQISQPSAKGSSALQGGLGGAGIGAQVGGPQGAAIGGVLGAIGGGQLGGK